MYNEYFSINKNFQSSINLELDLNNEQKIYEYIPTTDICDVLKQYIRCILDINRERATTLVGPYGKGKSFLLLVLSYLLGNNKKTKCWVDLVERIKKVDEELYDLLCKINSENINLIPIIINSNYENIKQSFQVSLNESLKREKLDDIIPGSVFSICLDLINKWEKDDNRKTEILNKCIELHNIDLKKLKKELTTFSYNSYKKFETLYNCVNVGLDFNPLINNDIVKMYDNVVYELNKKNYSGVFIIFDEFSKFLESGSNTLFADLKIIQDFAELCARGNKRAQVNMCCVTHKSFSLYIGKNKKDTISNSFKTVEGRFKEIKFNRSLDENYQLIASAINKQGNYKTIINKYLKENNEFYNRITSLNIFNTDNFTDSLYKGCFPLNPITVYGLIQLSELVAQNERTLFTFLSDSDENSLKTFIKNFNYGLFNIDKVYDYFSALLQKEQTNFIRNIWYRCESILSKLDNLIEKKIIKSIAILAMINDFDKLSINEEIISLSLNIDYKDVENVVNHLIEKHYLRRNLLNNMISFALSNSKAIDETIELLAKTKYRNQKYSEILESVNDRKYLIPRRYNEENKITRFFRVVFVDEEEFYNIRSFNQYFEDNYCDGLVIYLLKENLSDNNINYKLNSIKDNRVVIKYPKNSIDKHFYSLLMRNICLKDIINKKDIDEISAEEVSLLLDENTNDIRILIEKYYEKDYKFVSCLNSNPKFNNLLSTIMEEIYSYKLIFNNELVNKRNITVQYQKAINHVIEYLIDKEEDFNYSETSPESSIKYSILDFNQSNANFRNLIENIKSQIKAAGSSKKTVKNLIEAYCLPPYGIRLGVIPVILAKAISELSDNLILYYQSREIDLNANNLVKSIHLDKYYIEFSKSSIDQVNYLYSMKEMFNVSSQENFRKDTISLCEQIRRYFLGLPNIIRSCKLNNNYLNISEPLIKYKALFLGFNINPFECVYTLPKKIFNLNKYKELYKRIHDEVETIENSLYIFKQRIINKVKLLFNIELNTSLKMGIHEWVFKHIDRSKKIILSERCKKIYDCINDNMNYDDLSTINLFAKASVNTYIEDWDNDNCDLFIQQLSNFIQEVENVNYIDEKTNDFIKFSEREKLSPMAELLKNNVESTLTEFSDSVTTDEKIEILKTLIRDLI